MLNAEEARKISDKTQTEILSSPRFQHIFAVLEERIRKAAQRGDRSITWFRTYDPDLRIAYDGDDAFKNKLHELGYQFTYSTAGEYSLSW